MQKALRGLVAGFVLALVLATPAAWAGPVCGALTWSGWWSGAWAWVVSLWEKSEPGPAGTPCGGCEYTDEGLRIDEFG